MSAATKPLTPRQIEGLRYLVAYPHNPLRPDGVEAGTLGMLRRRGLVGKVVEGSGKGQRTLSPITAAGRALLASLDATLPGIGEVAK